MLHIVFITGRAGVGKTTYAFNLSTYYHKLNCNTGILNVSQHVKNCAKDFFNWDGKKDIKGRDLLQNIGKTMREYDKNLIINIAIQSIESKFALEYDYLKSDKELVFIIPDVRFDREIKVINKHFVEKYKEDYSNEVLYLTRTYESQLTKSQQLDGTELGISDYLIDLEVDLDDGD